MKKVIWIVLALTMVLSMAACGEKDKQPAEVGGNTQTQIATPFVDCETLDDAAKIAGFSLTAPASVPNWVNETQIRAVENDMIELIYTGIEQQQLRVRKANGNDDISGLYDSFDEVTEMTVDDLVVEIKGNGGKIYVATWTADDFTYAISTTEGLEQTHVETLVSDIK